MRRWWLGIVAAVVIAVVVVGRAQVSVATPAKAKPKGPVSIQLVKKACTGQRARCINPGINVVGLVKDCLYEEASASGKVFDSQFVCAVNCDPDTSKVPDALQCSPCKLDFAGKVIFASFDAIPAGTKKVLATNLSALKAAASDEARAQLAADQAVAAAQEALAASPNNQKLQEALGAAKNVATNIEDPTSKGPELAAKEKRKKLERDVLDGLLANMAPLIKTCVFDKTPGFAWEIDGTYSGTPNLVEDKQCKSTPTRDSFTNPMELRTTSEQVTETVHGATFFTWNHKTGSIEMAPTEEIVAELIHEGIHLGQEGCGRPNLTTPDAARAAYVLNEIQAYMYSSATLFYRDVLSAASFKALVTDPLGAQVAEFQQMRTGKRKCSNGAEVDAPELKISDDDRFYAGHWAFGRPWFSPRVLAPFRASDSQDVNSVFAWLCGPKYICADATSSPHTLPEFSQACPLVAK